MLSWLRPIYRSKLSPANTHPSGGMSSSLCPQIWTENKVESFQARPPSSLLANNPALEAIEVIASTSTWYFWDPLAFWALLGLLLCPDCKQPLSPDCWAKLPRRIATLVGIQLLLSRQYRCKECKSSEAPILCTPAASDVDSCLATILCNAAEYPFCTEEYLESLERLQLQLCCTIE
jgi:hypothetical protein